LLYYLYFKRGKVATKIFGIVSTGKSLAEERGHDSGGRKTTLSKPLTADADYPARKRRARPDHDSWR
jgi:hypothetical protein